MISNKEKKVEKKVEKEEEEEVEKEVEEERKNKEEKEKENKEIHLTKSDSTFNVDQITMELFMNKNAYQKIISKTNPVKFRENAMFQNQKKKYKKPILERTQQLLSTTYCQNNKIRGIIQDSFDQYVKQVIQELEIKEYENQSMKRDKIEEEQDDVLFGNCMTVGSDILSDDDAESEENVETKSVCDIPLEKVFEPCSSFWSKDKVIKR